MSQADVETLRAALRAWGEAGHMEAVTRGDIDMLAGPRSSVHLL